MPVEAKLLHVHEQRGRIVLWALVRRRNPIETRRIYVTGTGFSIDQDPGVYVGTAHIGELVWHAFDHGRA